MDHTRKKELLFDLKNDPQETKNLAPQTPEILEEMRERLRNWCLKMEKNDVGMLFDKPDQELIDVLKSLGYL